MPGDFEEQINSLFDRLDDLRHKTKIQDNQL